MLAAQGDAMNEQEQEKAAQALYEAYNNQGPNPWKAFNGGDVPQWKDHAAKRRMPGEKTPVELKWLAVAREAEKLFAKPSAAPAAK
jgi:hypothetical protein